MKRRETLSPIREISWWQSTWVWKTSPGESFRPMEWCEDSRIVMTGPKSGISGWWLPSFLLQNDKSYFRAYWFQTIGRKKSEIIIFKLAENRNDKEHSLRFFSLVGRHIWEVWVVRSRDKKRVHEYLPISRMDVFPWNKRLRWPGYAFSNSRNSEIRDFFAHSKRFTHVFTGSLTSYKNSRVNQGSNRRMLSHSTIRSGKTMMRGLWMP